MRGFVDLHCHFVVGVDDGVKTPEESVALLVGLRAAGFDTVVATPHMRPGMFDNDAPALTRAFADTRAQIHGHPGLPELHLASEHFLDDVVFARLIAGEGLPYPDLSPEPRAAGRKRAVLVELHPQRFPPQLHQRLFDLSRAGLRPVVAHPERYQPVWTDDACLDPLLDAGACLLLDVCALTGKYGRASQRAASKLLDEDAYEAACSDAHRPRDAEETARAIEALERAVGRGEAERLLRDGPRAILGL